MRIVNREKFSACPAGTLYREVQVDQEKFGPILVKQEGRNKNKDGEWYFRRLDLCGSVLDNDEYVDGDKVIALALKGDLEFEFNYETNILNHKPDPNIRYAVYSQDDTAALTAFLNTCSGQAKYFEYRQTRAAGTDCKSLSESILNDNPDLKIEVRHLKSQLKAPHWHNAIGAYAVGEEPTEASREAVDNISATLTRMLKFSVFKNEDDSTKFVDFLAGSCGFLVSPVPDMTNLFTYDEVPSIQFTGLKAMDRYKPNRKVGE